MCAARSAWQPQLDTRLLAPTVALSKSWNMYPMCCTTHSDNIMLLNYIVDLCVREQTI
jgi:hypothetical protein